MAGHVVKDIESYGMEKCILKLALDVVYKVISRDLLSLKGCYIYYDEKK